MQGYMKFIYLFFATLIVLVATSMVAMRGQTQNKAAPTNQGNLKKAAEDFYTITDYAAPEPTDPKKRALRHARGKRYGVRPAKGVDPKRFMITEKNESSFGSPSSHAPAELALPVAQSDAIIIGDVTAAEAFLSEDKTTIYSEFTVTVYDVLRDGSQSSLLAGSEITLERGGGGIRFGSGKVIRIGFGGKPLPRTKKRYLFFLKYNQEGQNFDIITGYELRGGRVFSLDGIDIDGRVLPQYAAYQAYAAADEVNFLNEVRAAIANASLSSSEGGRMKSWSEASLG